MWQQDLLFLLLAMFCAPAFMLGYIVRGYVQEWGGELAVLRKWWNKRKRT